MLLLHITLLLTKTIPPQSELNLLIKDYLSDYLTKHERYDFKHATDMEITRIYLTIHRTISAHLEKLSKTVKIEAQHLIQSKKETEIKKCTDRIETFFNHIRKYTNLSYFQTDDKILIIVKRGIEDFLTTIKEVFKERIIHLIEELNNDLILFYNHYMIFYFDKKAEHNWVIMNAIDGEIKVLFESLLPNMKMFIGNLKEALFMGESTDMMIYVNQVINDTEEFLRNADVDLYSVFVDELVVFNEQVGKVIKVQEGDFLGCADWFRKHILEMAKNLKKVN